MARGRYDTTLLIRDSDGPLHYATWDIPTSMAGYDIDDPTRDVSTVEHIWTHGDRLDKLSFKYMGSEDYWWAIALLNNISSPTSIEVGTKLNVPTDITDVLEKLELMG
jgi:nucleoid-associated protein YgaU